MTIFINDSCILFQIINYNLCSKVGQEVISPKYERVKKLITNY
jgi:hypothetical protein